jgi:hypothetical protein
VVEAASDARIVWRGRRGQTMESPIIHEKEFGLTCSAPTDLNES